MHVAEDERQGEDWGLDLEMQRRGVLGGRPRNVFHVQSSPHAKAIAQQAKESPNARLHWFAASEPTVVEHIAYLAQQQIAESTWETDLEGLSERVAYYVVRQVLGERLSIDWQLNENPSTANDFAQIFAIKLMIDFIVSRSVLADRRFQAWRKKLEKLTRGKPVNYDLDLRDYYLSGYAPQDAVDEVIDDG